MDAVTSYYFLHAKILKGTTTKQELKDKRKPTTVTIRFRHITQSILGGEPYN